MRGEGCGRDPCLLTRPQRVSDKQVYALKAIAPVDRSEPTIVALLKQKLALQALGKHCKSHRAFRAVNI